MSLRVLSYFTAGWLPWGTRFGLSSPLKFLPVGDRWPDEVLEHFIRLSKSATIFSMRESLGTLNLTRIINMGRKPVNQITDRAKRYRAQTRIMTAGALRRCADVIHFDQRAAILRAKWISTARVTLSAIFSRPSRLSRNAASRWFEI